MWLLRHWLPGCGTQSPCLWDRDINLCYKVVEGMNSSSPCKAKYLVFWVWCTMAEITPLPSVFLSSFSWNRTLLSLLLNKIAADKNCLRDFSKTLPFFLQTHDVRFTSNKSPTKQTSGKADQTCITQKKVLRRTGCECSLRKGCPGPPCEEQQGGAAAFELLRNCESILLAETAGERKCRSTNLPFWKTKKKS